MAARTALAVVAAVAVVATPQHDRGVAQASDGAAPGLRVERLRLPRASTAPAGNQIVTVVRVDPRRYSFRFLSEGHEGSRRPLTAWVRDFGLTGGINAGMFLPNGRSVGFLMQDGAVRSDRRPSQFEAIVGFGLPGRPEAIAMGGFGCGGDLASFRSRYRSVLQARRMLIECDGSARPWGGKKRFSAAAFGIDEKGWAVLVHSRTPYRMAVFVEMLASMKLGIRGLAYMEGGPEASLVVDGPDGRVQEIGSWEDGFNTNDDNHVFWDLPNIIGFAPRERR